MALENDIHIRIEGLAGRITLTRPQALNALSWDMALAMEEALIAWQEDEHVCLVVIDAEGERAFCAGGDIQELYDTGKAGDFGFGRRFWADEYRLNALIRAYPKPFVAIMKGFVMGGGVGISANGSHRIVTENTQIAMPECGIGLVPDVGGSLILAKAPGHCGEYLGTTGTRMNASDAIYAGFADTFVAQGKLESLIGRMVETGDVADISSFETEPTEPGTLAANLPKINICFSTATALQTLQALEADGSEWALAQAKLMRRHCPLSVACTQAMVQNARSYSNIIEALAQEYRFTYRSMSNGEFLEGVRAQIIDKDRNPAWVTPHLEEVTQAQIDAMLATLGENELQSRWKRHEEEKAT